MSDGIQIPTNVVEFHKTENGHIETGPNYSVRLPESFPLNPGGMRQAAPRRTELVRCNERFPRVAAAYELSVAHLQLAVEHLNRTRVDLAHAEATKLEIGIQIIEFLEKYQQQKMKEMESEANRQQSELGKACWEKFLEGVSVSIFMAKSVVNAHDIQPVDAESKGAKEQHETK